MASQLKRGPQPAASMAVAASERRPSLEVVLSGSPYPAIAIAEDGFARGANQAACKYFGMSEREIIATDPGKQREPRERVFRARHFPKWLAGDLYPAQIQWRGLRGEYDFLIIPFPLSKALGASLVLVFVPSALLGAALDGDLRAVAKEARRWVETLAAQVEALGSGPKPAVAITRPADPGFADLTPREWEIARRVTAGERVALLAEVLGISPNTVRNHLKAIFRKTGLRSQTALVRRLKAHGI